MKRGMSPTLKQIKFIEALKLGSETLNADHWLVVKDTPEELHITRKGTEYCRAVRIWNKREERWERR